MAESRNGLDRHGRSRTLVCLACGAWGQVETATRGSWRWEVLLWCLLALPGIAYSAWRLAGRRRVCALCGRADLAPEDSPAGRRRLSTQPALAPRGQGALVRLAWLLERLAAVSGVAVIMALEATLLYPPIRQSRALALAGGSALALHFLGMLGLVVLRVWSAARA